MTLEFYHAEEESGKLLPQSLKSKVVVAADSEDDSALLNTINEEETDTNERMISMSENHAAMR